MEVCTNTRSHLPHLQLDIPVSPNLLGRRGAISFCSSNNVKSGPRYERRGGISFDRADENALYVRMLADVKARPTEKEVSRERKKSSIIDVEQKILETLTLKEYKTRCRPRLLSLQSRHNKSRPPLLHKVSPQNGCLLDDGYSGQAQCLLSTIGEWDFNIFNLDKLTNGRSLFNVALHLFQQHNLIETFKLDILKLMRCINLIEDGYHANNPYHNSVHAADVTQAMHCYLMENKFASCVTPLEVMISLLSAMTHDLSHPGVNQVFLIATKNPLASLYKNSSVLENHHWRTAIGVLHESGIFSHLDSQQWERIEDQLKSLILATDITRQNEFLTQLKDHNDKGDFDLQNADHRHFLLQIGLKCADICNPCRPWDMSKHWSQRVCDEFYQQGDYERELGLKVNPMFDRHVTSVARIQEGFIQFVVRPLFTEWHRFNPTVLSKNMLSHLEANYQIWCRTIADQQEETKQSEKENERPADDKVNEVTDVGETHHDDGEPEPKEARQDDMSTPEENDVLMDGSHDLGHKKLSPVSEEQVDFPGFNLRRHSLPPNMLLADTSCLINSRRESFPCVEYSRRHSLPRNIYQSTSFDRLVDRLASVSEDPQNGRDFSVQGIEAKPKITTLSPSIETSRVTSAYQKSGHASAPQRYTITCTTIMRHRADDENMEISPRTVIISTKMMRDHEGMAESQPETTAVAETTKVQQSVPGETAVPSTFQTKPVLTSLPQNGSLHQKRLWGNNINNNSCHSGENHVKTLDLKSVIPVVLTKGGAGDSASMATTLKDIRTPSERPKSLSVHTSGQPGLGSGSQERRTLSGQPEET